MVWAPPLQFGFEWLSSSLHYVGSLRSFLTFGDFELHLVAFLQALISLTANGAVMNEYVWPIVTADKAVSLRVIEPLDRSFQSFH